MLIAKDQQSLRGFEIAGKDQGFILQPLLL